LRLVDCAPSKDIVRFGFFLVHQMALSAASVVDVGDSAAVISSALRRYQGEWAVGVRA
jgi:hypothetical protein